MQKMQQLFSNISEKLISQSKVQCAGRESEELELTNPEFGRMDPHLQVEDDEQQQMMMPPGMQQNSRKPPQFDGLMNGVKAITKKVEHIKGFKFDFVAAGSQNFHAGVSWVIPETAGGKQQGAQQMPMQQQMPGQEKTSHFGLNLQYVSGSMQTLMTGFPDFILTGRWQSTGQLECAYIKKLRENIQFRLNAAFPTGDDMQHARMVAETVIDGHDYSHTLRYGSGMMSFNHMQTIGRNFFAGYELMYLTEAKRPVLSYGAKYVHDKRHQFLGQYVAQAAEYSLAYSLNMKRRTNMVAELTYNEQEGKTNTVIGFQQRHSGSEVIATVNTKGKISTSLHIIGPTYGLKLCSIADYKKDKYKFGYGITIGQQQ